MEMKTIIELFKSMGVIFSGIIVFIITAIELQQILGIQYSIILGAVLWALLTSGWLVYQSITATSVTFVDNAENARAIAIKQLEKTESSLYYFGGVGFIGDDVAWRMELDKKLKNPDITVVRLIDLKSLEEMKGILQGVEEEKIKEYNKDYIAWLELHSKNLKDTLADNLFYHFSGAPIWKFGLNYLIFDKKDILIVFLSTEVNKNAVFINNRPDIAEAITGYIDWVKRSLKLKEVTDKDLERIVKGSEVPEDT